MGPRMNQYERQREPVGTPDVKSFLFHDLYLSVMNISPDGQSLGLLALINPMVGWIWGATGLMALGGMLTLVPQRRTAAAAAAEVHR
jgi:cytochrome c biogenesis factor